MEYSLSVYTWHLAAMGIGHSLDRVSYIANEMKTFGRNSNYKEQQWLKEQHTVTYSDLPLLCSRGIDPVFHSNFTFE